MSASALDLRLPPFVASRRTSVVLDADLALAPGDPAAVRSRLAEIVAGVGPTSPGAQRRLGVHQPGRATPPPGSSTRRGPRGCAHRDGRGLDQARQLHPGRRGRVGPTTSWRAHGRGAGAASLEVTGVDLRRETRCVGFTAQPSTGGRGSSTTDPEVPWGRSRPRPERRSIPGSGLAGSRCSATPAAGGCGGVVDLGLVLAVVAGASRSPCARRCSTSDRSTSSVRSTPPRRPSRPLPASARAPLMDLDLRAAGTRVEALPWVARVTLHRGLGGTVAIRVTERTPAAVAAATATPAPLVDATGRVLARPGDRRRSGGSPRRGSSGSRAACPPATRSRRGGGRAGAGGGA